jgi:prepilin-type processing-associated H-X9-DG protein
MKSWGIPLLDWLAVLHDGQGGWKEGLCFDAAHPNSEGHRLMVDSIDLGLFDLRRQEWSSTSTQAMLEIPVFQDAGGLHLYVKPEEKSIRVMNSSAYSYGLSPGWTELQTALTLNQQLMPGIYIANSSANATLPFFSLTTDRKLETYLEIHPNADLEYHPAFHAFSPHRCQILFYDGHVGILKESDLSVRILNESDHDYNLHPMWQEVRSAFKGMAAGVYTDPLYPDMPFRTLMVGPEGLESRIKVAAKSSFVLHYQGPLSSIRRVGIVPLGDRCAVRMMLYKMEYDGPAFPFDLTRTTNLGDVADMIASGFHDMWNPALLQYDPEAGRIYHRRWTGLSFAHEVEDNEDPIHHMDPIYARMRTRYQARAQRFWYTVKNADELLFVRTGSSPRGYVLDLMHKLRACCQDKPLRLLVLSPQASWEFAELPDVLHFQVEFNPDQMYDDLGYWLYCTEVFRGMLNCLGVSCKTLFWCPPQP